MRENKDGNLGENEKEIKNKTCFKIAANFCWQSLW